MSGYAVAGVPYLWALEIKSDWQLRVHGFVLKQGIYHQIIADDPDDTHLEMPAPIPVTLDLTRLLPAREQ